MTVGTLRVPFVEMDRPLFALCSRRGNNLGHGIDPIRPNSEQLMHCVPDLRQREKGVRQQKINHQEPTAAPRPRPSDKRDNLIPFSPFRWRDGVRA